MNKKFVIIFFASVIVIASLITIKLPQKEDKTVKNELSLEEAKEQLLLTKGIRVGRIPLESDSLVPCLEIQEEGTIQEIIKILDESYIPPDDWYYTLSRSINYYLEFLDEKNQIFATVQTKSSSPFEFKGKGYTYHIYSDDKMHFNEILKKHCEITSN